MASQEGRPASELQDDESTGDRGWLPSELATAHDAIITTNAEGQVVQFNEAAERLFGYSDEEACGKGIANLILPPEHQGDYWAGMLRVVTGDGVELGLDDGIELSAIKKDGTRIPVMLTATRTIDPPLLLRGFFRDLSEQRAAESRSGWNDRRLAQAEELMLQGTLVMDLETTEVTWSDELFRLLGLEPGDVTPSAEALLARVHPVDRKEVSRRLAAVAENPKLIADEGLTSVIRLVSESGNVRVAQCFGRAESDETGEPARWVVSVQDVTELEYTKRFLGAHDAVSSALHDWTSFEVGSALLLDRLGTALGYSLGSFWTRSEAEGPLVCRAFWSAPDVPGEELETLTRRVAYQPGQGAPGRAWVAGAPLIAEDIRLEDRSKINDTAIKLQMSSAVAFAAMSESGPLGVVCFFSRDRVLTTEHLEKTLASLGQELGRFLEHHQTDFGARSVSPRELEVLKFAADGNTGPAIARMLQVSPATVKTHFENIYEKLGVSDRAAAVARAIRSGLIR